MATTETAEAATEVAEPERVNRGRKAPAETIKYVEDMTDRLNLLMDGFGGRVGRIEQGLVDLEVKLAKHTEQKRASNIVASLARVMGQAARVEKSETHPQHGYKYAGVESLMEAVNKSMASEGLLLVPTIVKITREKLNERSYARTHMWLTYTFYHSTGETLGPIEWEAEADDTSDKGRSKALTAARKSFLRDVFLISFGDEAAHDPDRNVDSGQAQPAKAPARRSAPPAAAPPPAKADPPVHPVAKARRDAIVVAAKAAGLVKGTGSVSKDHLEVVGAAALPARYGIAEKTRPPITDAELDVLLDALEWVKAAHVGEDYTGKFTEENETGGPPYLEPYDVADFPTLSEVVTDWHAYRSREAK